MKPRFVSLYALFLVPALLFVGCGDDQTAPDTTAPLAPVLEGANVDQNVVAVWWQENSEPDLAGYFVYVQQDGNTRQINSHALAQPYALVEVESSSPVHVYVTAIDWSGNESSPSETRRAIESSESQDSRSDSRDKPEGL